VFFTFQLFLILLQTISGSFATIQLTKWYGVVLQSQGHCNVDWYEPFGGANGAKPKHNVKLIFKNGTDPNQMKNRKTHAELEGSVKYLT